MWEETVVGEPSMINNFMIMAPPLVRTVRMGGALDKGLLGTKTLQMPKIENGQGIFEWGKKTVRKKWVGNLKLGVPVTKLRKFF